MHTLVPRWRETEFAEQPCHIDTKNFMVRGPAISFLSAFPAEEEYLFPPLTYLEPTPEGVQTLRVDDATFTVIDVQPAQ